MILFSAPGSTLSKKRAWLITTPFDRALAAPAAPRTAAAPPRPNLQPAEARPNRAKARRLR